MSGEQTKQIIHYWTELLDIEEITCLANILKEQSIFTQKDLTTIFSCGDYSHKRRMFLFHLLEQDESVIRVLVEWLTSKGYHELALKLTHTKSGCTLFRQPEEEEEDEDELTSSIEINPFPINDDQTPLSVKVSLADEFLDTMNNNPNLPFYYSRSKRRGKVLIINNFDFTGTGHPYRNGAIVDQKNLESLFCQMGGWVIDMNNNKTADEMKLLLQDFANDKNQETYDICFVFILSHGSEKINTTIVYGKDGSYIATEEIENYFINENCPLFRGKPKVFIYQVCRGAEIDLSRIYYTEFDGKLKIPSAEDTELLEPIRKVYRPEDDMLTYTEFDGKYRETSNPIPRYRRIDDMLVGFATVQGTRAHRDPFRGTWYIELICTHFMTLAKEESVEDILSKVDEGLRKRMSEMHTVQTSEKISKGFKRLYLNPGIYEENGVLKRFS